MTAVAGRNAPGRRLTEKQKAGTIAGPGSLVLAGCPDKTYRMFQFQEFRKPTVK